MDYGYIDFVPLRFPVVGGSPEVSGELLPVGFVRHGSAPTVEGAASAARSVAEDGADNGAVSHQGDLLRGPTLVVTLSGNQFQTLVVEVDAQLDGLGELDPVESVRHGAPVPSGGQFATASAAVHAALSVMTERVVRAEPHCVHVHAGAVSVAGLGVVIPATSGVGKTTLTGELGAFGGVLTDELVAVDRAAAELHAPKRPLSVKQSGFERAAGRYPDLTPQQPDEFVWHITLDSIGLEHVLRVVPGVIAIPTRRPGSVEIDVIDPCEALMELIAHSYDLDVDPARAFADLVWLVSSCACLSLTYEDATDLAPELAAWLKDRPRSTVAPVVRVDRPDDGVLGVRIGIGEVWWNPETREAAWVETSETP